MGDKDASDLNAFHGSMVWGFVSFLEKTSAVKFSVFPAEDLYLQFSSAWVEWLHGGLDDSC